MTTLKVLIAEGNPDESLPVQRTIEVDINKMPGMHIDVEVVSSLAAALSKGAKGADIHAILLYLDLKDATPDEIIAAIPDLETPVIVVLDAPDPALQARIRTLDAQVMVKCLTRHSDVCTFIINCLTKGLVKASKNLPED